MTKKIMFNDRYNLTQAVLEGRKTQTRRLIPKKFFSLNWDVACDTLIYEDEIGALDDIKNSKYARYKVGELVAVAQNYCTIAEELQDCKNATCAGHYEKNLERAAKYIFEEFHPGFHNKMFVAADKMIHQIRITDVRVEHLQDISDGDCLREGIIHAYTMEDGTKIYHTPHVNGDYDLSTDDVKKAFAHLINKVSRKDVWSENPYVFVYDFELIK